MDQQWISCINNVELHDINNLIQNGYNVNTFNNYALRRIIFLLKKNLSNDWYDSLFVIIKLLLENDADITVNNHYVLRFLIYQHNNLRINNFYFCKFIELIVSFYNEYDVFLLKFSGETIWIYILKVLTYENNPICDISYMMDYFINNSGFGNCVSLFKNICLKNMYSITCKYSLMFVLCSGLNEDFINSVIDDYLLFTDLECCEYIHKYYLMRQNYNMCDKITQIKLMLK